MLLDIIMHFVEVYNNKPTFLEKSKNISFLFFQQQFEFGALTLHSISHALGRSSCALQAFL